MRWKPKGFSSRSPKHTRITLTAETPPILFKLCMHMTRQPEEIIYLAVSWYANIMLPQPDPSKAAPKGRGGAATTLPVKSTLKKLLDKTKKSKIEHLTEKPKRR